MENSLAPYMKHYGKTPEEQLEKNKPLLEWLKREIEEEITDEEAKANHEELESLKQTIDSFRPEGCKLFSE